MSSLDFLVQGGFLFVACNSHIKPLSLNGMGLPVEPQPEDDTEAIDDDVADLIEWL
jgi:hypothetical protein